MNPIDHQPILGASLLPTSDILGLYRRESRFPRFSDIARRLREMRSKGISVLEISLYQMGFFPQFATPEFIRKCALEALSLGFQLSAHVPFPEAQILSHIDKVRAASIEHLVASAAVLKDMPVRGFVIHIEGRFFEWMDKDAKGKLHKDFLERAFETGCASIKQIFRVIPRDKFLLENLPPTNLNLLRRWAERFKVPICLDVGHIYLAKKKLRPSILLLKDYIDHVHLHDIVRKRSKDGKTYLDDHHALGTGILDIRTFLKLHARYFSHAPLILEQRWHWARRSAAYLQKLLRKGEA